MEKKDLQKKILETASQLETKPLLSTNEAWEKVRAGIKNEPEAKVRQFPILKLAASLALIIVSVFLVTFYAGNVELATNESQLSDHQLPDGSIVTLNSNTEIRYNSALWFLDRSVEMKGEAFFEVEKGQKFSVFTSTGEVSVLGTKFNVAQRKDAFHVACFEGRVAVNNSNGDSETILTEGLATRLDNNKLTDPFSFNKEKLAAWKNGLFFFEKESLNLVFEEIEAHYGIEIRYDAEINEKKFSGVFNKGELNNVLEIVCSSMGLSYEIEEEEVRITQ